MLTQLHIKNFGLIDEASLNFAQGLTVFTGETGAGKSMLIDAFSLALGARGGKGFVHQGAPFATIEATFELTPQHPSLAYLLELGIESEENILFMRRQIMPEGQTRCFVCGVRVNQNQMATLGAMLADIHGQRDQQFLLQPKYHSTLLDQFGCTQAANLMEKAYRVWHKKFKELKTLQEKEATRLREIEVLKAYVEELEAFKPVEGEVTYLTEQRQTLMEAEKLTAAFQEVEHLLNAHAPSQGLAKIERILSTIGAENKTLTKILGELATALDVVADAEQNLEHFIATFEANPEQLEILDERLHTLKQLCRKHQCMEDELPQKQQELIEALSTLEHFEEASHQLTQEEQKYRSAFDKACHTLTKERQKTAKKLTEALQKELKNLKMPNAQFEARLTPLHPTDWGQGGAENVAFFVRFNAGSPFEALEKAASGGEVSRLMLALKVVLFATLSSQTLVFDEIDTGVSGAVAEAMGKCLRALGGQHQVFSITHLPQVAAQGEAHMVISKNIVNGITKTHVKQLKETSREGEIARMLSGEDLTHAAKEAAKSLLAARN